jgi:cytochrome b
VSSGFSGTVTRTKIWDWPTRAIHWSLVLLIPFAWWTYKTDRMDWHRLAGYAVIALLAFRLFLGVFGAETSRFARFLRGPRAVWRYLAHGEAGVGHNPIGGWSVAAMLALLVAQPVLGLFASDENGLDSGPFADRVSLEQGIQVEHLHALFFYGLVGLVALHIAAIAYYALRGRNLVGPMITGRASLADNTAPPRMARASIMILGLLLAGIVFMGLWHWGA